MKQRIRLLLLGLVLSLFSTTAGANLLSILIDSDQNPASGCAVTLADGSQVDGVEFHANAGVTTTLPPRVSLVNVSTCNGGAFDPPQTLPADVPVGLDLGIDGSDVVEFSVPLALLGLNPGDVIDVVVVGTDPNRTPVQVALPNVVVTPSVAATPAVSVNTLSIIGLLLLAAALAWFGVRHLPRSVTAVGLVAVLGFGVVLVFASNFVVDGLIDDWQDESPIATLPAGSGSSAANDIRQVFAAAENGTMFFRIDVTDLESVAPPMRLQVQGPDYVLEGQNVSLYVTVQGFQGAPTFSWQQVSGPTASLGSTTTADTSFVAPSVTAPTSLRFEVTATDGRGPATATFDVQILPDSIFVDAGQDRTVTAGDVVSLHAHGQGSGGSASYNWAQQSPATPVATLNGAATANPNFVAPTVSVPTTLEFEVTFTDGTLTTNDRVNVTVYPAAQAPKSPHAPLTLPIPIQQPPLLVVAQPPAEVPSGTTQTLIALASGGDGNTSWSWSFTGSQPPAAPAPTLGPVNGPVLSVDLPALTQQTRYSFSVTATDGNGDTATETTSLLVDPSPGAKPLNVVAPSLAVDEGPKPVAISARAEGGTGPYQFQWTQTAGPTVALANADTAIAAFQPPAVNANTTLTFEVTVTDAASTTVSRALNVLVRDSFALHPPQVLRLQPLPPVDVLGGNSVNLAVGATGGTPPYSWSWAKVSGPSVTLSGTSSATLGVTTASVAQPQTLELEVTVTDGASNSVSETVQVNVLAAPSALPLSLTPVPVQHIDEGQPATLTAVARGGTGNYNFSWKFVPGSGVQNLALTGANTNVLRFTAPQVPAKTTLQFELTLTDGAGALMETVHVVVNDITPPLALNLANAQPLTVHSGDLVALTPGSATGGEGPYTYSWTQFSGPSVTLAGGNTPNPTFTAPPVTQSTALAFRMTVTDTLGNQVSMTEPVTVDPPSTPLKARLTGPSSAASGSSISLNTQAIGGVPPYAFRYTTSGAQVAVSAPQNPTVTLPQVTVDTDVTFTLMVHDSDTPPATANDSLTVTVIAPLPPLQVSLVATDPAANEQGPETGEFTVTTSRAAPAGGLTVNLAPIGGTATPGTDYTALPTSVSIPGGQTSATLTVTPITDTATEGDETVVLTLAPGVGYDVGPTNSGTVTIADGPTASPVVLTLNALEPSAKEGTIDGIGSTRATLQIIGTNIPTTGITARLQVGGTATHGDDWTMGRLPGDQVNLPEMLIASDRGHDYFRNRLFNTLPDLETEGDETITFTLLPDPAYQVGSPSTATLTIQNVTSASPSECMVCGDLDSGVPCTDLDLVLATTNQCDASTPYCMNDFVQQNGALVQFRRCVDYTTCDHLWYGNTSDNPQCTPFDRTKQTDITCHMCCQGDGCNTVDNPPASTLFRPN